MRSRKQSVCGKPITVSFYVGGKPVEKLTEEQLARISQRLSKTMSDYYTAHPEEYAKLESSPVDEDEENLHG